MSITADYCALASGARLLEYFRVGMTWYADAGFPKADFKIGAQVAFFLCLNIDRVREFADSEGLRPSHGFKDEIKGGAVAIKVRCKSTFIANRCGKPTLFKYCY